MKTAARYVIITLGFNSYRNEGVTPLSYALRDRRRMYWQFLLAGYECFALSEDLSQSEIVQQIALIASGLKRGDVLIIHVSGHGCSQYGQAFFLCLDGSPNDVPNGDCISFERLLRRVNKPGLKVVFIFDVCRTELSAEAKGAGKSEGLDEVTWRSIGVQEKQSEPVCDFSIIWAGKPGSAAGEFKELGGGLLSVAISYLVAEARRADGALRVGTDFVQTLTERMGGLCQKYAKDKICPSVSHGTTEPVLIPPRDERPGLHLPSLLRYLFPTPGLTTVKAWLTSATMGLGIVLVVAAVVLMFNHQARDWVGKHLNTPLAQNNGPAVTQKNPDTTASPGAANPPGAAVPTKAPTTTNQPSQPIVQVPPETKPVPTSPPPSVPVELAAPKDVKVLTNPGGKGLKIEWSEVSGLSYEVWGGIKPDLKESQLLSPRVVGFSWVHKSAVEGTTHYWVKAVSGTQSSLWSEMAQGVVLPTLKGLDYDRADDGAITLKLPVSPTDLPEDTIVEVHAAIEGKELKQLHKVGTKITSLPWPPEVPILGTQKARVEAWLSSAKWGNGGAATSNVPEVKMPEVKKTVLASSGRWDVADAGVTKATGFVLYAKPEGGAEKIQAAFDLASLVKQKNLVGLPAVKPRKTTYRLMAVNAGGETALGLPTDLQPSRETPLMASIGVPFVPAGTTNVLFATHHTRVKDFALFVKETGYNASGEGWSFDPDDKTKGVTQWKKMDHDWQKPGFEQTENHPVAFMSYQDATIFCRWLTERERKAATIGPKDYFRLPLDEEWSRAAGTNKYVWGEAWPPPANSGNFAGEEFDEGWSRISGYKDGWKRTSPVGSFLPNSYGLFDMSGNLWQWMESWYRKEMNSAEARKTIPALENDGGGNSYRVLRGGSWINSYPVFLARSSRDRESPANRYDHNGFRVVLVVDSSPLAGN